MDTDPYDRISELTIQRDAAQTENTQLRESRHDISLELADSIMRNNDLCALRDRLASQITDLRALLEQYEYRYGRTFILEKHAGGSFVEQEETT